MLILAGTPIGNLGDASARLIETLRRADAIACEDTRTTGRLLQLLGIDHHPRLLPLHEHNEDARAAELARLALESDVVLVTDAGMPGISDPGYPVVRACAQLGATVTVVPGPSAVITALAVSGLPTDRFAFEGFAPRRAGERERLADALATEPRTTVFYESPHRLADLLAVFAAHWPERQAAVCRELTKKFEQIERGTVAELANWAADGVRGEIVLVIGPADEVAADADSALARVLELTAGGMRLKDAAAKVAAETGLGRRDLYEAALLARD